MPSRLDTKLTQTLKETLFVCQYSPLCYSLLWMSCIGSIPCQGCCCCGCCCYCWNIMGEIEWHGELEGSYFIYSIKLSILLGDQISLHIVHLPWCVCGMVGQKNYYCLSCLITYSVSISVRCSRPTDSSRVICSREWNQNKSTEINHNQPV